ncbi:MAG: hypothetical protein NUW01_06615 [Gemmatimonadaceae bacterium]|nr:hypothetical protein [Gemmatimonadaceae bacterium]
MPIIIDAQYTLEPGTIYAHLDDAVHAATCLCGLHRDGCTVYGTTQGPDVSPESGEAYRLACRCTRTDGSTWAVPSLPYEPVYTITKPKPACELCGEPAGEGNALCPACASSR